MAKNVNICDVCTEIFAGGDAPKGRISKTRTEKFAIPIYSNGEENAGLYGFTDVSRVNVPSVTVSARGTIGYAAIRTEPFVPIVRLITLVPDESKIDIKYLYYAVQNYQFEGSGTSIPQLTVPMLKKYNFTLPTKEVQKNVVSALDKVNALIALRKEQLAKLDELVKARFVEMFGDLEHTVFPKCKMAEIADIKHGYAFSGEFFTEEDNNILLVTPGNFKIGGGFQEKKCKFYTGEYPDEFILHSGDLIVTMTDLSKRMDTLGYAAIVPQTERVYLHNQRIGLFINISNLINKTFMMHFMQTNDYRDKVVASSTGSTVHHTSPTKILDCEIFVPPIELQSKFASFVEQTDKTKLTIQASLDKLEVMKKALMQEYFG